MCPGGVRAQPVPWPAQPLRQAAASAALPAHRLLSRHRAALLRSAGGEDAHRDPAARHAALRLQLQLALHACPEGAATSPPLQRERALTVAPRPRGPYSTGKGPPTSVLVFNDAPDQMF